ncbi:hypothetical protein BHE74_00006053 [Ensete ventricosum]|nr:hypothetical protein BHE74_00006053 [Ensete ventricosum]
MYRCRTSELKEIKISFCCALVSWLHKIGVDSDVILILIVILVFVVHQRSFQLPICSYEHLLSFFLQMYQHGSFGMISVAFALF